jgi:electron transfer flavoprotein alpha subunit
MDFDYLDQLLEDQVGLEEVEESYSGYRNIWVFAETAEGKPLPATLATLGQARELADQIGVYVYTTLLGPAEETLGQQLIGFGADRVLVAGDPRLAEYQPELYVAALGDLVAQYRPEILLLAATPLGACLAPRLAQRLNTGLISHCTRVAVDMSERLLLGTVPTLSGEVYHTYTCPEARPQIASLEPGFFRMPYPDPVRSGIIQSVDVSLAEAAGRLVWTDLNADPGLPAVELSRAQVVVAAGRGMRDKDGFALVEKLAAALGGKVAGSRGALDEGWIGEEEVIGVGGQSISPDLYVACGLSGDVFHSFGIQGAKFVVAINSDEHAPIMQVANLAVVGDARQVVAAMLSALV